MPTKNFSEKISGNIRKNIREYIRVNDINQFEFAQQCGLSPATISKILNKTRDLTFGTTELIALAMKMQPEEIILDRSNDVEDKDAA